MSAPSQPPADKMDLSLRAYGWQHQQDGRYAHPSYPDDSIQVTVRGAHGGQNAHWLHTSGGEKQKDGEGTNLLEYHLMCHNRRNRVGDVVGLVQPDLEQHR